MKPILLCAVAAVARAVPSDLPQPLRGVVLDPANKFGIRGGHEVPVEWELPAFKGGPTLTLNGTVQEVHKRLLEVNPDYDADFNMSEARGPNLSKRTGVERRTDFSNAQVLCSTKLFGACDIDAMWKGINYLYSLVGRPKNKGGPAACGRVSCSHDTAIWWCNDASPPQSAFTVHAANTGNQSHEPKRLLGWNSIADGAQKIWGMCAGHTEYGYQPWEVSGQVFHPTDWNVIIRSDWC